MTRQRAMSQSRRRRLDQRLAEGVQFQRAGNLRDAERCFRKVVDADPGHVPALHSLALLLRQRGELLAAVELLQQAAAAAGADAGVCNNLGNMLIEAGRPSEALVAFRRAVTLDPGHEAARLRLAQLLIDSGEPGAACVHLEHAWRSGVREPVLAESLARACVDAGDAGAAAAAFSAAAVAAADDGSMGTQLAGLMLELGCPEEAAALAGDTAVRFPGHAPAHRVVAACRLMLGQFAEAEGAFRSVLGLHPGDAEATMGVIRCLVEQGRHEEAIALCRQQVEQFPALPDGQANLGIVLRHLGRYEEAVAALRAAVAIDPGFSAGWNNLGMTLLDMGEVEQAQACFQRALDAVPGEPVALFNVMRTRRNRPEHAAQIQQLEQNLDVGRMSSEDRVFGHFALGKAFGDLGDHDRSFLHYEKGNALKRRSVSFEPGAFRSWVAGIESTFDAAFLAATRGFGAISERPVFVVGLPRSGTTLVEQILASHPDVYGADELTLIGDLVESLPRRLSTPTPYPQAARQLDRQQVTTMAEEYLAHIGSLDRNAMRVTDKMPENFLHLGLIAMLFPRARVIHCTRDAMDVCFSNFIQLFAEGHEYAYSLEHIAAFYNGYRAIMRHWSTALPLQLHEVGYETLLEDPAAVTRKMLDYMGLDWDDACMDFHRTQRVVRTASHWQVRQPIYRGSHGRWRRYASHLAGLAAAIGYEESHHAGVTDGAPPQVSGTTDMQGEA